MVTTATQQLRDDRSERDAEFVGVWDAYRFWRCFESEDRRDTDSDTSVFQPDPVQRARWIKRFDIAYIGHDDFDLPAVRRELLCSDIGRTRKAAASVPSGNSPYVASLYRTPLLDREEEIALFRRMNGLKHLAVEVQQRIDIDEPDPADLFQFEWLMAEASRVRNLIIEANLRLVFALAKRFAGNDQEEFGEYVAEGNVALMRAVELFDFSRGFRFSTYAHHVIRRQLLHRVQAELRRRERFVAGGEEAAADMPRDDGRAIRDNQRVHVARQAVRDLLPCLTDRERAVIEVRFGLGEGRNPQTYEEIGRRLGVSKERIRQLQERALKKMARSARGNSVVNAWEEVVQ
jgi:RNA polymerase sigma factor (sigma-70 family)